MTFNEPMPPARLKVYVDNLADIPQPQLAQAIGRAVREAHFFPKIAELRELAGIVRTDTERAEALAAWQTALHFADKHYHPDFGIHGAAPRLSARIHFAVRQVGGFFALFNRDLRSEPFMQKQFLDAYRLAPHAEHSMLGSAEVKALPEGNDEQQ